MLLKAIQKYVSYAIVASFSTVLILSTQSSAEQVSLGDFDGTLTTKVSSGFSVRTEDNDCTLVSGNQSTLDAATKALNLIGDNPHVGNGGCNVKIVDDYGTPAGRVISIGGVNGDDGRLNFPNAGDIIDAGQNLAIGFDGRNSAGVGVNISGSVLYNPVLNVNNAVFKKLTNKGEDHLESQIEIGNAYITAPVSDNMDITLGNYVQSQGATALFPIGVNVVNPVSLPILRSPAASLKDALLPQPMIGATIFSDTGMTVEAYYQLQQKEVILDAAGSFFGSELVGVGENTGALNSPFYNEDGTLPFDGAYFNVVECIKGVGAGTNCDASNSDHVFAQGSNGIYTSDSFSAGFDLMQILWASDGAALQTFTASSDIDGTLVAGATGISAVYAGAVQGQGMGAISNAMTNAQLATAFNRFHTQFPGLGTQRGLVNIHTAAKDEAKDSGQYGLNLTGYVDDVGAGIEWGLYYNNSHSNSPRVRFLAIADGYTTDAYALFGTLVGAGYVDYTNTNAGATKTMVDALETYLGGISYGATICNALITGYDSGDFKNSTHLHDPANCYSVAAAAGASSQLEGGAMGAAATLGFPGSARIQQYYPEDIQTFGASATTEVDGISVNLEVAYRPDFPLQIDDAQLFQNIIDSTGGTLVQSFATWGGAAAAGHPSAGAASAVIGSNKWSSQPNCDISTATGTMSTEMSGYVECDGTAEFDVLTFNSNFSSLLAGSDPIVVSSGADSGFWLLDIGVVHVEGLNDAQGLVKSNQFQNGYDVYKNQCKDQAGTALLSFQANALFGSDYCENNAGPDSTAIAYKIRGGLTYNNFNNSPWTFSPSIGFNHDAIGNAPTTIGGFVEDRMSASVTAAFNNGNTDVSLSYVSQMGDAEVNSSTDKDYVSASISYTF